MAVGTNLDDDAVHLLARMHQLRYLEVNNTQLTADGVAGLREALPDCAVVWDDDLYRASPSPAAATANAESSATDVAP